MSGYIEFTCMPHEYDIHIPQKMVENSQILSRLHERGERHLLVDSESMCHAILLADGQDISTDKDYIEMITRLADKYDLLPDSRYMEFNVTGGDTSKTTTNININFHALDLSLLILVLFLHNLLS